MSLVEEREALLGEINVNDPVAVRRELHRRLAFLTPAQLEYVHTRVLTESNKEAAELCGLHFTTIANWPSYVNDVVELLRLDILSAARIKLERAAYKAAKALEDELGKPLSVHAAKDILDRVGLRAPARVDITSGGERVGDIVGDSTKERVDRLTRLFNAAGVRASREGSQDQPLEELPSDR